MKAFDYIEKIPLVEFGYLLIPYRYGTTLILHECGHILFTSLFQFLIGTVQRRTGSGSGGCILLVLIPYRYGTTVKIYRILGNGV